MLLIILPPVFFFFLVEINYIYTSEKNLWDLTITRSLTYNMHIFSSKATNVHCSGIQNVMNTKKNGMRYHYLARLKEYSIILIQSSFIYSTFTGCLLKA